MPDPAPPRRPLRACLLSGGASRRMGRDKALLLHPCGGTWLEATLTLLAGLGAPVTLLSGHQHHLAMAERLAAGLPVPLAPIRESPPHGGPLPALKQLIERYRNERLLLCPVDMPWLTAAVLEQLVRIAAGRPDRIHLAHDGTRFQPLLGVYPADAPQRASLEAALAGGELRLQTWLAGRRPLPVPLPARPLRNANRPEDLAERSNVGARGDPDTRFASGWPPARG